LASRWTNWRFACMPGVGSEDAMSDDVPHSAIICPLEMVRNAPDAVVDQLRGSDARFVVLNAGSETTITLTSDLSQLRDVLPAEELVERLETDAAGMAVELADARPEIDHGAAGHLVVEVPHGTLDISTEGAAVHSVSGQFLSQPAPLMPTGIRLAGTTAQVETKRKYRCDAHGHVVTLRTGSSGDRCPKTLADGTRCDGLLSPY
jgi:hypothetical protein